MTQEVNGCVSQPAWICNGATVSTTPVITTTSVFSTTTSIAGTSGASANIRVFVNGVQVSTVAGTSGGRWTATGLNLVIGDVITVYAVESSKCISAVSAGVTVAGTTNRPVITGTYCTTSNITLVSGFVSGAPTGTRVQIFDNGVSEGSITTTTGTGYFEAKSGISIPAGNTITARATITGYLASATSLGVTVNAGSSDPLLSVTSSLVEGNTSIVGKATTGYTVRVYIDGTLLATTTATGGGFTVSGISSTEIYAGGSVYATSSNNSCESNPSNTVIVSCILPSTSLAVSPSNFTICSGF
ncbi:MAG: hypothetical protein EAY68_10660, partial [Bacteroidetes bacterium]